MLTIAEVKRVFHQPDLSLTSLKNCTLAWDEILIYPSHVQGFGNSDIASILVELFEEDIVKIAYDPSKLNFMDKVWVTTDNDLYQYLRDNVHDICITPDLDEEDEEEIEETSEKNKQDNNFKEIFYRQKLLDWERGYKKAMRERGLLNAKTPAAKQIREEAYSKAKELARYEARHFWEKGRETFLRGTNRTLLEMKKKKATILPTDQQRIYYRYKFNPNILAENPKRAVNIIIPLWGNIELEELDFDEVLEIRDISSWKEAMNELRELSFNTEMNPQSEEFEEWIEDQVRQIFLQSCETPEPKWKSTLKFGFSLGRNLSYSAIDLILPGLGTTLSSLDIIAQKYLESQSNQALPLFLSSLRDYEDY